MSNAASAIYQAAQQYGLSKNIADAMVAIAHNESGLNPGSIGDQGTSYGLFQLHRGGALGNMNDAQARAYLDPYKNAAFAARAIAGLHLGNTSTQDAIGQIARRFERPANPEAEINNALAYLHSSGGGGAAPSYSPVATQGPTDAVSTSRQLLQQMLMQHPSTDPGDVNAQTSQLISMLKGGGGPAARPLAKGVATDVTSGPISPNAPNVVNLAKKYLGTKYTWGGTTPQGGFDCSGFVQWLYKQQGVNIPRTTYDQIKVGQHIDMKNLQPGDIIFFSANGDVHHEGLYIGNGQFIHAPHTGDVVKISSLSEPYYQQQFAGGRRV